MARRPDDPVMLAEVLRGDAVEARHTGAVAIVLPDGREVLLGPADQPTWARSSIKPLQALPLLEHDVARRLALDDAEIAVVCASHEGTDAHVAVVDRLLSKAGHSRADFGCGPHAPFDKQSALAIARRGGKPEPVHNNCSGKHAGFLALAKALDAPLDRYLEPDAPGQVLVRQVVAELAGIEADSIPVAIDGCGAPTLGLSPIHLARAFRRVVNPTGLADVRAAACARILAAVSSEPFYLAGDGRLETELVLSAPGKVLPKCGAEGVYAVGAITPRGPVGVAVKVADGAERGYQPAVVAVLRSLGLWNEVPERLARFACVPVYNTQKRPVGSVRCALEVPDHW